MGRRQTKPYLPALHRLVLAPLGLTQTGLPLTLPALATRFGPLLGAGGLWAAPQDLLLFAAAGGGAAAAPAAWTEPCRPPGLPPGVDAAAPGWFLSGGLHWHDGVARRSRSGLGFVPATGAAAALVCGGGSSAPRGQVSAALWAALSPQHP